MKQVSDDLKNAGRIDGLSGIHDLLPAGAAAGAASDGDGRRLHHDPDLERSVVPADPGAVGGDQDRSRSARRCSSASSSPTGTRSWPRLSLAILPVLILYLIFSRQLIRGITSGAVK